MGATDAMEDLEIQYSDRADRSELQHLINRVVLVTTGIVVEDLLNSDNANNCIEEVSDEILVPQVIEKVDNPDPIETGVGNTDEAHPLP